MSYLIFTLGLLIGSFLNVCIFRIPKKEDIVFTPSHCTNCSNPIRWYDLIPVISYIFLGGKCRHCKAKISIIYPIIELLNGAAYMGIFCIYGPSKETVIYSALFSILLVISMIDLKHSIIPNGLVIAIMVLAVINLGFDFSNWISYTIGFFCVSGILLLIAVITGGKMGGGDIKLMAAAGLLLGWEKILLALMIGAIIGAVIGIALIVMKVITRKQMIPFGPFLSLGIIISALFFESILNWYINSVLHL